MPSPADTQLASRLSAPLAEAHRYVVELPPGQDCAEVIHDTLIADDEIVAWAHEQAPESFLTFRAMCEPTDGQPAKPSPQVERLEDGLRRRGAEIAARGVAAPAYKDLPYNDPLRVRTRAYMRVFTDLRAMTATASRSVNGASLGRRTASRPRGAGRPAVRRRACARAADSDPDDPESASGRPGRHVRGCAGPPGGGA